MQTQITATVHLYFQTPTPQDAAVVEISTIYEKKKNTATITGTPEVTTTNKIFILTEMEIKSSVAERWVEWASAMSNTKYYFYICVSLSETTFCESCDAK